MIGQISSMAFIWQLRSISIVGMRHDVSIYTHRGSYRDNSKLALYRLLLHCNKNFKQL